MLTVRDHMTLSFEGRHWRFPAAKDSAIREQFGETPTRYYQRLNALLDNAAALGEYPTTVRRLQRLRDARRGRRSVELAQQP